MAAQLQDQINLGINIHLIADKGRHQNCLAVINLMLKLITGGNGEISEL